MTDKIKKLEQLSEEVYPQFPTLNRGGYVEDSVDAWLEQHLKEVGSIIEYQNYGVDLVNGLEAEVAEAKGEVERLQEELGEAKTYNDGLSEQNRLLEARVQELEAEDTRSFVEEVSNTTELDQLRNELAEARAQIAELEKANEAPAPGTEATRAATLLQHASELGAQYIEQAKADGEQIRKDAEATLVEMRREIEELDAKRFATLHSLSEFFTLELAKLHENPLFAETNADEEVVEEEVAEGDFITDENGDAETIDGVPVTQAQVQEWADEAEAGVEDEDVSEEEISADDETLDETAEGEADAETADDENRENVETTSKTEDDLR